MATVSSSAREVKSQITDNKSLTVGSIKSEDGSKSWEVELLIRVKQPNGSYKYLDLSKLDQSNDEFSSLVQKASNSAMKVINSTSKSIKLDTVAHFEETGIVMRDGSIAPYHKKPPELSKPLKALSDFDSTSTDISALNEDFRQIYAADKSTTPQAKFNQATDTYIQGRMAELTKTRGPEEKILNLYHAFSCQAATGKGTFKIPEDVPENLAKTKKWFETENRKLLTAPSTTPLTTKAKLQAFNALDLHLTSPETFDTNLFSDFSQAMNELFIKTFPQKELSSAFETIPLTPAKLAPPKALSQLLDVDNHPKYSSIEIQVPIADLGGLRLTKESHLPEIFRRVNHVVLSAPYAINPETHKVSADIYRPNHNGTHAVRRLRLAEGIMHLTFEKGSDAAKAGLSALSEEERLHLKLGAYLMRAGRLDEEGFSSGDDYKKRSAAIYEAHAKQLGASQTTIDWMKEIITKAAVPHNKLGESFQNKITAGNVAYEPKTQFAYETLTHAHDLDLVRCWPKSGSGNSYDSVLNSFSSKLTSYFVHGDHASKVDSYKDDLADLARNLCKKTGEQRQFTSASDTKTGRNLELFREYSLDGQKAWTAVSSVSLPIWG